MSSLLTRLTEKTQAAKEKIAKNKEVQDALKQIEHEKKLKEALDNALEMIPKIENNLLHAAERGQNSFTVIVVQWSANDTLNVYENTYRQEIMNYFSNAGLKVEVQTVTNKPNSHLASYPKSNYNHNLIISW